MLVGASWTGRAIRQHLRSRRFVVWAALLTLLSVYLASEPLLGVLGFEFAFAMALVTSLACVDLGAAAVRRLRQTEAPALVRAVPPARIVFGLAIRAAVVHLGLLVLPLIVISLNALRVQNCDWWFGLKAYAVMPGLSAVVATGIGVSCGFCTRRRLPSVIAPYVVVLALAVHSLWKFYSAPPVFSYNPLVGYFPGNLYDENIDFSAAFWWSRVYQLQWLLAMLTAVSLLLDVPSARCRLARRPRRRRWRLIVATLLLSVNASVLWVLSGRLQFNVDTGDIASALGGRYRTEHFTIIYPRAGPIAEDIELIAADHEFRLAQLERTFGFELPGRITSLYFASADQKFEWMGARGVYMAKPWRKEIYVHHEAFPHQVLRHELAHVMAGRFGDPVFHVSAKRVAGLPLLFNVGLIEGIAVAADWPDHFTRPLTPHQAVKALRQLEMLPPVEHLMSTGFFSFSAARSYTVAGSFVRYLYDEHGGAAPLGVLYGTGGDFSRAYGRSFGDLATRWLRMIDQVELPEGAAEVVRERFRRRSIFDRACPHAIARKLSRASDLEGSGDLPGAIRLARSVCRDAPSEPRHQIRLADLLQRAGEDAEASAIYEQIADEEETVSSTLRAQALLRRIDQAARAGDFETAGRLLDRAAHLPVQDSLLRNIEARRWVAKSTWPSAEKLREFFWGEGGSAYDRIRVAREAIDIEPDSGLAHYLEGRHLIPEGELDAAVIALSTSLSLGLPHPLLRREAARLLAETAYRTGDYPYVELAAEVLMEDGQPDVMRLYGADWIERLRWRETGSVQ